MPMLFPVSDESSDIAFSNCLYPIMHQGHTTSDTISILIKEVAIVIPKLSTWNNYGESHR